MYRTAGFNLTGTNLNTNGAGDTFLSMVARLEHERHHHVEHYSILEVMAIASGTAAYFIENQNLGRTVTENNVKRYLEGKELQWEYLGNIDQLDTLAGKLSGKEPEWQHLRNFKEPGTIGGKISQYPITEYYSKNELVREVTKC
jgi:hypothetical protein